MSYIKKEEVWDFELEEGVVKHEKEDYSTYDDDMDWQPYFSDDE